MENKIFKTFVIGLEKSGMRFEKFLNNNNHLQAEFYQGIKGDEISNEERISIGLISKEDPILMTDGAVGCAISHKNLWNITKKSDIGALILEDDVITHPQIYDFIYTNLHELMKFDITFFSINTNSILESITPEGVRNIMHFNDKHPSEKRIKEILQKTNLREVRVNKLIKSFGFSSYFISPKGASLLNEKIFPLKSVPFDIPYVNNKFIPNTSDGEANRHYYKINALVCVPFLAYSPNIDSSTKLEIKFSF